MVDAGHGGYDNGARYNGRREKDDTLALALEVGSILESRGQDVVYTRTEDIYQSPAEKAQLANASGADYFISIHRNSGTVPNQYSGVQSLIYNEGGIKQDIAENINENLEALGFPNIGIDLRPNLAVLKQTSMPAVLVEAGFINNDRDNQIFDNEFENVALAIANGVLDAIANSPSSGQRMAPYRVQVGLFSQYSNATAQYDRLLQDGYPVELMQLGGLYAILSGSFTTAAEANRYANTLRQAGYDAAVVKL